MERLIIEFADLDDLLEDGQITYPIRLTSTNVVDPLPPIQLMSFIISVRAINIEGQILAWTHRHARIQFVRNVREEAPGPLRETEAEAIKLKEAITTYIIQKTGIRQHAIRSGLINITPRHFTLHGELPEDLFKKEEPIEETHPTPK